jgi:hypothetical protein
MFFTGVSAGMDMAIYLISRLFDTPDTKVSDDV